MREREKSEREGKKEKRENVREIARESEREREREREGESAEGVNRYCNPSDIKKVFHEKYSNVIFYSLPSLIAFQRGVEGGIPTTQGKG